MKKITTTVILLCLCFTMFAQKGFIPRAYDKKPMYNEVYTKDINNTLQVKTPGDTIWYEDFDGDRWSGTSSNGNPVPSNAPEGYGLVDQTANGFFWRWDVVGPRGAYVSPDGSGCGPNPYWQLESTTALNGYLMMELDYYNTDDQCNSVNNPVNHDSYVEYGSLDFSEYGYVKLLFQQSSVFCCTGYGEDSDSFLSFSVDGGSTWEKISVHTTDINAVGHNRTTEVNVSSYVGGESNVRFRFHIQGESSYWWIIDDIAFVEPYEYDLALNDYWNDYLFMTYPDGTNSGNGIQATYDFYGGFWMQPWFVIENHVNFRGAFENNGTQSRTNVVYHVDITRNGEDYAQLQSLPMAWNPTDIDTMSVDFSLTSGQNYASDTAWKTFQKGEYLTTHYFTSNESEQNTGNDTLYREFNITDSVLTYVDTTHINSTVTPDNWTSYTGDGDGVGFWVTLPEPSAYDHMSSSPYYLVKSLRVFIPDQLEEAEALFMNGQASLIAKAFRYDYENNEMSTTPFLLSSPYVLSLSDTNQWVTISFLSDGFSEYLYDGGSYVFALEFYGTYTTDRLHTFTIGQERGRKVPDFYANQIWSGGTWGWGHAAPAIALNMSFSASYPDSLGMQMVQEELNFDIYPNPNRGQFTIDTHGKTQVTIIDAIGSVVESFSVTGRQTVDLRHLETGVYFVRVIMNGKYATKQIIIV